jgi:hypothetical protein
MLLMIANAMGVLTVIFNNFTGIEKTNIHTWLYKNYPKETQPLSSFPCWVLLCVLTVRVPCCDVRCDFRIQAMLLSYLRHLRLSTYSDVQHILCCIFALLVFVLCTLCFKFLWIVHLWLPLQYSRTFMKHRNKTSLNVPVILVTLSFLDVTKLWLETTSYDIRTKNTLKTLQYDIFAGRIMIRLATTIPWAI